MSKVDLLAEITQGPSPHARLVGFLGIASIVAELAEPSTCRESGHCSDGVEVPTDSFSRDGSASSSRHCLLTEQPQERIEAVNRQSSSVLEKNGKHGSFLDKAPHAPK
ncbi:hypothetical protein [Hyphomicrobium nitrativorans]|uniref:hypothetical protein n=1 Tax=Hyphomicrobium nitrativorans TaxID=1427356 RepID=UPI0011839EE6|nr:hypothetical protein [Hyphomicrobium nitrativorans]